MPSGGERVETPRQPGGRVWWAPRSVSVSGIVWNSRVTYTLHMYRWLRAGFLSLLRCFKAFYTFKGIIQEHLIVFQNKIMWVSGQKSKSSAQKWKPLYHIAMPWDNEIILFVCLFVFVWEGSVFQNVWLFGHSISGIFQSVSLRAAATVALQKKNPKPWHSSMSSHLPGCSSGWRGSALARCTRRLCLVTRRELRVNRLQPLETGRSWNGSPGSPFWVLPPLSPAAPTQPRWKITKPQRQFSVFLHTGDKFLYLTL